MDQSDVEASEKFNLSECPPNTYSVQMNTSEDPIVEEEENKQNCSSRFKIGLEFLMSFFTLKRLCGLLIIAVVIIVVCAFNPPTRIVYRPTVLTSNCTATKLTSDATTPFPSTPFTYQNEDFDVSAEPHRPNQDHNKEPQIEVFPSKGQIDKGQDLLILCEFPHVNRHGYIDFYRDKDMLFNKTEGVMMNHYRKSSFATLHIEKAKPADTGSYHCTFSELGCFRADCLSAKSESVNVTVI